MKKISIFSIALFAIGCKTENVKIRATDIVVEGSIVNIYTIDSCEYVGYLSHSQYDYLSHKGNCKFCIKRRSQ